MTQPIVPNLVSTIIPVYNRPAMLQTAVKSVLKQSHPSIEIIIVDDGSTDHTPNVAQSFVQRHPDKVRLYFQTNGGPGPARERGRQQASGEFIQYLDSDDRLTPNKFTDQIEALRKHPQCDVAYGKTRLVDSQGHVLKEVFKWTGRQIPTLFPGLLVDRWWCTHTPLYRRRLSDRIGAWSDMRWSQDWEYDARVGAINTQLVHCDSTVSEHVHHAGMRQTSFANWSTDPVRLANRVRLLESLWSNATQAGVPSTAPERQHFARWCFTIARNCAAQDLRHDAARCLDLAEQAAGPRGIGKRGIKLYRSLARALGYSLAQSVVAKFQPFRRIAGKATMQQSFAS